MSVDRAAARRLARALADEAASAAPDEVLQVLLLLGDVDPGVRHAGAAAVRWLGRRAANEWEAFVWRAVEVAELAEEAFDGCGCADPTYGGGCPAMIWHGPGHQSHTHCRVRGDHVVHEAVYGPERRFAAWRGGKVFSGVFDEPPDDPDDEG